MPHQRLRPSFSFDEERIKQLKQIAPEAFADGKINWKVLQEALGENLEEEGQDIEHFGLFWPGKREARRLAAIPSQGTLVPCPGEGVDEENTRNIFIEGENLEVLKLLQKSYAGRIKMIYIDPPYNTGNDFVYEDDFKEPVEEYYRRTGQVDEEGKPLTTNKKADGRFHSKWLSMMYPRLRLASNLLSSDGFIFVSIDDNEFHNIKHIMDEVFGEENFRNIFLVRRYDKNINRQFMEEGLSTFNTGCEYIVAYSNDTEAKFNPIFRESSEERKNFGYWKGFWNDANRPTMRYNLLGVKPESGQWKWKKDTAAEAVANYIEYKNKHSKEMSIEEYWDKTGKSKKFIRRTENGKGVNKGVEHWIAPTSGILRNTLWSDVFASKIVDNIDLPFNNPKNPEMIMNLLSLVMEKEMEGQIVLDYFAGSGSTAQAVIKINKENDFNISFICVQLQEVIDKEEEAYKAGHKKISDITKAKIFASLKKYKEAKGDFGIKVYELAKSNYKMWENYVGTDSSQLEAQFEAFETPLKPGWKKRDLLVEIMLLEGFPLVSKAVKMKGLDKNKVEIVNSDFCEHRLLVCLDEKIYTDTAKDLQYQENDIFICLDSALTDQLKLTLADKLLLKTI